MNTSSFSSIWEFRDVDAQRGDSFTMVSNKESTRVQKPFWEKNQHKTLGFPLDFACVGSLCCLLYRYYCLVKRGGWDWCGGESSCWKFNQKPHQKTEHTCFSFIAVLHYKYRECTGLSINECLYAFTHNLIHDLYEFTSPTVDETLYSWRWKREKSQESGPSLSEDESLSLSVGG